VWSLDRYSKLLNRQRRVSEILDHWFGTVDRPSGPWGTEMFGH